MGTARKKCTSGVRGLAWEAYVATYGDRPQEVYVGRTWTGVGSIRILLVGFFSVGCTSIRIIATLGYE
jgi:hypothetical protein